MKKIFKSKNREASDEKYRVITGDIGSAKIVHKNVWKRFFHTVQVADIPYITFLFFVIISIAENTFLIYIPQVNADFFNGDASVRSVAMFLAAELLSNLVVQLVLYVNQVFRAKSNRNLRNVLWGKILKVRSKFYDKVSASTLLSRITVDTESLNAFMLDIIWEMFLSIYTLILTIREMSRISLKASFILLVFVPVAWLIAFIMGRLNIRFENAAKFRMSNLTDYLSELISSLPVVKSFNRQEFETKRGENVINEYYIAQRNLIVLDVLKQIISTAFNVLPEIVIIYMGVRLLSEKSIDAAGWYIFYVYAGSLLNFVVELSGFWQKTKTVQGQLATVTQVLLEEEEGFEHYINKVIESGDISFDKVSFAYGEKTVLDKVSFTLEKNKTTAIVGYSGSGKSTLLKFMERIYDPDSGRILLAGKDLKDYDLKEWRDKIAVVSQESPMISGSIRENILYGIRREVSDEEIMKAAKLAFVDEFIRKCPDVLDHNVGQFGSKLSGGQRQKISIARAILSDPEYLILDEPTASLDMLSANEIASTVQKLHGKMTIIIVAHQPDMIIGADRIVVVNRDHTAVEGTHRELLAVNYFYQKLMNNELEVVLDEK